MTRDQRKEFISLRGLKGGVLHVKLRDVINVAAPTEENCQALGIEVSV